MFCTSLRLSRCSSRRRNTAASSSVLSLICISFASGSAAGQFRLVSCFHQVGMQLLAVIALDLDDTIFDRAAGSAGLFEFASQLLQGFFGERQSGDQRYTLAAPPLG